MRKRQKRGAGRKENRLKKKSYSTSGDYVDYVEVHALLFKISIFLKKEKGREIKKEILNFPFFKLMK